MVKMNAEPYEFEFDPASTALVIIDMQRDFVQPGGFGEALGNDVTPLQAVIAPCRRMLDSARRIGMMVALRDADGPESGTGGRAAPGGNGKLKGRGPSRATGSGSAGPCRA